MPKYRVTLEIGYGEPPLSYEYVAATPAKAKYMCYKEIWGNVGCLPPECRKKDWSFMRFIELFSPDVERIV